MAAETRRETAEIRKRKDKRRVIVKSGSVRNESMGGRREGGEDKFAQHETSYMCDRRLTADERHIHDNSYSSRTCRIWACQHSKISGMDFQYKKFQGRDDVAVWFI